MADKAKHAPPLPSPIVVACQADNLDELLGIEWLIANDLGSYASSTVVGCNTRRYHGLLIAATSPPIGRVAALSTIMEQLIVGQQTHDLATNEFADAINPAGYVNLVEFRNDVAATYVYRMGKLELTKQLILAESDSAVGVRYALSGGAGVLVLSPFVALRDFHHLRSAGESKTLTCESTESGVVVGEDDSALGRLHMWAQMGEFRADGQWWRRFRYRADEARGQDCFEDLYTPGVWRVELQDGQACDFSASFGGNVIVDFDAAAGQRRRRLGEITASISPGADQTTQRLAAATDTFVVRRPFADSAPSATVLAGYHWFADWGRDAFIALPGLLLSTGRFAQARETFGTFARHISDGMVPNRFDDYAAEAHYNSIDASLWFIIAAERYVEATGDLAFWRQTLMPAANAILTAYRNGTAFDIHADTDGLLTGGSIGTQLTWMDAALGEDVITPRHGKAVEVNALWYAAHRIMAHRCAAFNRQATAEYAGQAEMIAKAFCQAFWNEQAGCLYDCITDGQPDPSIRPNQILAVSLPHRPLPPDNQAAVVAVVADKLLTPLGLRTLAPGDLRYCPRYEGAQPQRDRAYHQGTVWPWLIGPFIEAYLKVNDNSPDAIGQADRWLGAFDEHLSQAGLGYISEIFDADRPHRPRGCIAQAWSVAEVLRVKLLLERLKESS